MTDNDVILRIVQDFHKKIDDGLKDVHAHIAQGISTLSEAYEKLRTDNDKDHDDIYSRISAVDAKQATADATMRGAWKVLAAIASAIGVVGGWLLSWFTGR